MLRTLTGFAIGSTGALLFGALLVSFIQASPSSGPPATQSQDLVAVSTDLPPVLDGAGEDPVWQRATPITIPVMGGVNLFNGATEVVVRAAYDSENLYLAAQWRDPTESVQRMPWQKQPDGSWQQLRAGASGDENTYYEDKLALLWNINTPSFSQAGCAATCHAGEPGKPFGNKYTPNPGELIDIWHWKGVRTGPVGQVDDQYLDSTRYDSQAAPEAGRKSDPRTGGGYSDNAATDGPRPRFALPGQQTAPPYWILDSEKVELEDSAYRPGDEVPGMVIAPFQGDRGDISAASSYSGGIWTLEMARRLVTGSQYDIQFDDLGRPYEVGVAVFDNAQVRHAFQSGVTRLVFGQ